MPVSFRNSDVSWFITCVLVASAFLLAAAPARAQLTFVSLHSFNYTNGERPQTGLVQGRDGNFYGTTPQGGADGVGTVFKVTPAGTLTTLYSFTGRTDGSAPNGLVLGTDGNFYGTASQGGAFIAPSGIGYGTVFQVTPAGVLTTLVSFNGTDGSSPQAALVQGSDGNFYGTTYDGGASGEGTAFQITPTGALTTLHSFSALNNSDFENSDGASPEAALVLGTDGNFYGSTTQGGTSANGTVFKVTVGGVLTTLADAGSQAALVLGTDGNFYGTAEHGGVNGTGDVFQVTPAGVLTTLHSFAAIPPNYVNADGAYPLGVLVLGADGNFYGTTEYGGVNGDGTVFKITSAGTLTTLANFTGANGALPQAALVLGGDGNFYGTTYGGGTASEGTVFQMTPAGSIATLFNFIGAGGINPASALVLGADGNFYGTTEHGGVNGDGAVFKVTSAGALTTLVNFNGADGASPSAALVLGTDGNFYGTTYYGGANGDGTAFQMTPAGNLTTLVNFNGANGSGPFGTLIEGADGNFYGTTQYGGASVSPNNPSGDGTFFKVTTTGGLTTLVNFTGTEGGILSGDLVQGGDGNFYETALYGGADNDGTVFQVTPAGTVTVLVNFTGTNGAYPGALIEGTDGNLYGATGAGTNAGTIYKLTLAGALTTLDSSTGGSDGPASSLIEGTDGNFYGTTAGIEYGLTGESVFKLTPAGGLTTLYTFTGGTDGYELNGLTEGGDGNFYGTTQRGGTSGDGTVFGLFGPPTAFGASESTNENMPVTFTVAFDDPSGQGIASIAFPMPPAHGTLAVGAIAETGTTGTVALTYTPVTGYSGADNFTYTVTSSVVGTSSPQTVTLAIIGPPTIASFSPPSGPVGTSVVMTGANFAGAQSVTFGGMAATFTVNSPTQITATVPTGATTGVITVQTSAGLSAGAANFTVVAPPTVSLTAGTQTSTTTPFTATAASGNGAALTYRWSASPATAFTGATTGSIGSGTAFVNTLAPSASGTYMVTVTVTDAYGQTATAARSVAFAQIPTKVTVGPTTVSIAETGSQPFTASVLDQFGTAIAAPTVAWSVSGGGTINASSGVFTAGKTPGTYTVTAAATSNGVTSKGTASVTVVNITPTITGFMPASGPVGTTVIITGTNLTGTSIVGFQGQHATSFTVNSAGTQITTTVPANAATGPVAVLTPGGEAKSSTNFTVTVAIPKPTITGFTPASGPVGTVVTIMGTNLTMASIVGFQGQHAKSFTVNGAGTQITAAVPAGAVTGPIAVLTPGGTVKSATSFTVTH